MIKLAVGLPAYGEKIDKSHAGMWLSFGHALAANEDQFDLVGFNEVDGNPVADSRNRIIWDAYAAEADWVLMCDSDTYYRGENDDCLNDGAGLQILQMIKDADRAGAAVVGAPVRARRFPGFARTVWMMDKISRAPSGRPTMSVADEACYAGQLVECARIGGAFLAINLNWLKEKMPDPPWFTHEPIMQGPRFERLHCYGEDVGFCDSVKIKGGKIFVDGRIFPRHVMVSERK